MKGQQQKMPCEPSRLLNLPVIAVVVAIKSVERILLSAFGQLQTEYDKLRLLCISSPQGLRAREFPTQPGKYLLFILSKWLMLLKPITQCKNRRG